MTDMDDKELERLAQEELLKEAKRGKIRAETMGAMGWQKCPIPSTNKRFLTNMIKSTLEPPKKKDKTKDYDHERKKSRKHHRDYDEKEHRIEEPSNKLINKEHKMNKSHDHRKESSRTKHRHSKDASSRKSRHKTHKSRSEKS